VAASSKFHGCTRGSRGRTRSGRSVRC
jgi:hypothetical protein